MRRWLTLAGCVALLGVAGCGGNLCPVSGRVTFDDGSPLDAGLVVCEARVGDKPVMARGGLRPDGTFELGTDKPGDGARPGKYRVLVMPRGLSAAEASKRPPIIDRKFEKYETSGIEFEVKAGQKNELNITVTRPKGRTG